MIAVLFLMGGGESVICFSLGSIQRISIGWKILKNPFQRVEAFDNGDAGADVPLQTVKDGSEGIGEDVVVVDESAIGTAGSIGDTPAEGLGRTGKDLTDAMAVLEADFVGGGWVMEAPGFYNGEELPTNLGFFLGGKFNGMTRVGNERSSKAQRPSPTPVASMTICCGDHCPARFLI
jgi:hypothetical protein